MGNVFSGFGLNNKKFIISKMEENTKIFVFGGIALAIFLFIYYMTNTIFLPAVVISIGMLAFWYFSTVSGQCQAKNWNWTPPMPTESRYFTPEDL